MDIEDKREKLKQYYFSIKDCKNCNLAATRTNFVFGSGNANSVIMFIGEAPGRNEDLQGKPFVGQAGKLLDDLLASINLNRNEVFIANVLKCRPPQNRDPNLEEISKCKNYLFKQIEIINPSIICTLGKYSTQLLLNTDEGITALRGRVFKIGNRFILPINHPAAALYTPSRFEILKLDFKRIQKILGIVKSNFNDGSINIEYSYDLKQVNFDNTTENATNSINFISSDEYKNLKDKEILNNNLNTNTLENTNNSKTKNDKNNKNLSQKQLGLF